MITATRLFRWGPHYRIGIPAIDQDHERIVESLNSLYNAHRTKASREEIAVGLRQLIAAAGAHFTTEERIMTDGNYPGAEDHSAEHAFLHRYVLEFQRDFGAGKADLGDSMLIFLKDWLREHILISDRRLGNFLGKSR